jgi:hypothetical protein
MEKWHSLCSRTPSASAKDDLTAGGSLSMQEKNPNLGDDPGLPPRPGEAVPADVGKKGGEQPERPEGPTDVPRHKPGVEKGPENTPTV